jgi:YbbR domain-containing protein
MAAIKILKRITYNWHIKLISLVLAAIVWIYVNSLQEKEKFLSVPLSVTGVPEDYLVASEIPQTVKVVLRGREEKLALVNEEKIAAVIDMAGSGAGLTRHRVKIDEKTIPQNVTIKEITPRTIDVLLEKALTKKVKVVPVLVADLPYGYTLEDVIIDPDTVEVTGPESYLETIGSVYTREINLKDVSETTIFKVNLDTSNKKISLGAVKSVNVKVVVKEEFVVKRVAGIPVYAMNLKDGLSFSIKDTEVSVLLKLPKRKERNFKEDVYVYVDCTGIEKPGLYHLPLLFKSEQDMTLVKIEPETVPVEIR